ncbi:MAG: ParB/RepB/Spo0J family partition protein [Treponema sp.]|jgi:ParB/RepB/Spo0J family partition protein|nr:ParB/RepB/Spo0J family partition protein [Treponema sp.]
MKEIGVADIVSVSDRKHGGEGNISALAESIGKYGLIQPVVVKYTGDTRYRLVAGRRRLAAVQHLGWDTIPAIVLGKDVDDDTAGAIALAENVNRFDMHPLDEAAHFKKLHRSGMTVEEIARYYDRSVPGIYHRIRLDNLMDELKGLFLDNKMNLTTASVLSGLDPEHQEQFYQRFGKNSVINQYKVNDFFWNSQKNRLGFDLDEGCRTCTSRTYHKGNELFFEYNSFDDVCFDSDCFRAKWAAKIVEAVKQARDEYDGDQEVKPVLALDTSLSKYFDKQDRVTIGGADFSFLDSGEFCEARLNGKETEGYPSGFYAWHVARFCQYEISVRLEYFIKNKDEEEVQDERRKFGIVNDIIGVPESQGAETEAALHKKYEREYKLAQAVQHEVLKKTIQRNADPAPDPERDSRFIKVFLDRYFPCVDSANRKDIYLSYTGEEWTGSYETLSTLPAARLCVLWTALSIHDYDVPDLSDFNRLEEYFEENLFTKFTGLSLDGFKSLYRETLDELVRKARNADGSDDEDFEDHEE